MIHPTKSFLVIFACISIAVMAPSFGCKKTQSGPANSTSQPNTTTSSGPGAKLDRFVGEWGAYSSRSSSVSGKVGLDSKFVKTTVKKTSGDAVMLEADSWLAKGALRYDSASQKYLLSLTAEDFPGLNNLPMTFSDSDGFSGETTFKNGDKEYKATATIKDDKGASQWEAKVTQGKDFWSLRLRLGKDQ